MAIHTMENVKMSGGFSKQIDEGAKELIFDNLQRFQYQYPIKSTIRELVSNGLDSVREKNIARSILNGFTKVEDHYDTIEGEVYKDSKFNPDYYNLSFLSDDDTVRVIYKDGGTADKHYVAVRDYGVGLGEARLKGYFNLGYSTKRLSRFPLGKFGLGAKSPLSTGTPFYTVTSRHNGREYQFNVYAHRTESIIPKWNIAGESLNIPFTLPDVLDGEGNPLIMYCRETAEQNMVEIQMQVKQHHKQGYIDAVTSQLLYFSNVEMQIINKDGNIQYVDSKAKIIYEDEYIVLAENSPHNRPHILLNNVNYGLIDFKELELEERAGNVGIKVIPDQVSVNPSRESLIWDDTTREVVVNRFNEVLEIAEKTLSNELAEPDFLKWMYACSQVENRESFWSSRQNNTVIGRLASIIDMKAVQLKYSVDPKIRYWYGVFEGITARVVKMSYRNEGAKKLKRVDYTGGAKTEIANNLPVIVQVSTTSNRKNKYMLEQLYPSGFINLILQHKKFPVKPEDITDETMIKDVISVYRDGRRKDVDHINADFAKDYIARLHNCILMSENIIWYEDIKVPDDYTATEEVEEDHKEEEAEEAVVKEAQLSAAERRKQTGSTLIHGLRVVSDHEMRKMNKAFEFCAIDVTFEAIDKWPNDEIFYGNNQDDLLLQSAALITRPLRNPNFTWNWERGEVDKLRVQGYPRLDNRDYASLYAFRDKAPVRLFKVSQANQKFYRDFKHITSFFKTISNKTITMASALIRWNTGRLLSERFHEITFLKGFAQFSPDRHAAYDKIYNYIEKYYRPISDLRVAGAGEMAQPLISHLDKVTQFQLFVRQNPDDAPAIAQLAKEMFNPESGVEIQDGKAIDLDIYDEFNDLLDWAANVSPMLNMIQRLTGNAAPTFNTAEADAIVAYCHYRQCQL